MVPISQAVPTFSKHISCELLVQIMKTSTKIRAMNKFVGLYLVTIKQLWATTTLSLGRKLGWQVQEDQPIKILNFLGRFQQR